MQQGGAYTGDSLQTNPASAQAMGRVGVAKSMMAITMRKIPCPVRHFPSIHKSLLQRQVDDRLRVGTDSVQLGR